MIPEQMIQWFISDLSQLTKLIHMSDEDQSTSICECHDKFAKYAMFTFSQPRNHCRNYK